MFVAVVEVGVVRSTTGAAEGDFGRPGVAGLKDSRPAYTKIIKKSGFFFGFGCDVQIDIFVTSDPFDMPSTKIKSYGHVAFISGVYGQSWNISATPSSGSSSPRFDLISETCRSSVPPRRESFKGALTGMCVRNLGYLLHLL